VVGKLNPILDHEAKASFRVLPQVTTFHSHIHFCIWLCILCPLPPLSLSFECWCSSELILTFHEHSEHTIAAAVIIFFQCNLFCVMTSTTYILTPCHHPDPYPEHQTYRTTSWSFLYWCVIEISTQLVQNVTPVSSYSKAAPLSNPSSITTHVVARVRNLDQSSALLVTLSTATLSPDFASSSRTGKLLHSHCSNYKNSSSALAWITTRFLTGSQAPV
jgi:hypothetical protein